MESLADHLKKGTGDGALFYGVQISLLCAYLLAAPVAAEPASSQLPGSQQAHCLSRLKPEPVNVARVTDGDTLVLSDKRRVRLIGINTLELNDKNTNRREWARRATLALEQFVSAGQISLIPGIETHDNYGRLLAHISKPDGRAASHALVSQGLAIAVAVGKNTRCANELLALEQTALQTDQGLWAATANWQFGKARLTGTEKGFRIVHARVVQIAGRGKRRTLILDNGLTLRLGRHWPSGDTSAQRMLDSIVGRQITAKGWLGNSSGKAYMTLNHPTNLDVLKR